MNLRFDSLISFEEKLNTKEMKYLTVEKRICEYILNIGNLSAEFNAIETARTRLKYFKQCMYFCSSGLENPMFLDIAKDSLLLSENNLDILNIHRLMYIYMCDENREYLKLDNKFNKYGDRYENCSFTWKIPYPFAPYLAAYILAAFSINRKTAPANSFFKKLDHYFDTAAKTKYHDQKTPDINIEEIYPDWTNEYLGRKYFSTLETLYKKYAQTPEQKATIRNATRGLTSILTDSYYHKSPSAIPTYMNLLLEQFEKELTEKVLNKGAIQNVTDKKEENQKAPDKKEKSQKALERKESDKNSDSNKSNNTIPPLTDPTLLYKHEEAWNANEELSFLDQRCKELSEATNKFLDFIGNQLEDNHISSKYPLAIKDFDKFKEQYETHLQKLKSMLKNIKVSFCQRCKDIIEDYYVAQRIAERSFIFDNNNAETHIKELYKIISHYYQEIITEFEKFIKKVKKSSSSNPQNYRTITTEDDYFSNLKDSIKLSQDRLSKKLEERTSNLP